MSKTFRKFLVMLLVLTVTLAFSGMSAFAYTAVDDDGVRDNANEESMHVVYSTKGMLRFMDEGTSATLSEDGKTVNVVATTSKIASWGKVTKLALIEQEATAEEKDEAAKAIKFDDDTLTEEAVSRTVHFSIPVEEVGKMIPICRYVDGEWKDFSEQAYIIVLEEGITPVELAIDNSIKMFKPETATLGVKDGKPAVNLVLGSDSYTAVYPGYASEATDEKTIPIEIKDGKGYVTIPFEEFEKETVLAFKGSKFFNRTMSVSAKDKKVTFVPTEIKLDQFENMTTEEAIAHAKDYATVDLVNALIESIQVQSRNENTDKYCAIAKAYWDALSDKDKEKDDGYFSEDTGDASKDDPLNQDNIGENELLVVSFGTSFNGSRAEDIGGVEKALQKAFPDWSVRRAFTAQIIINHVQARDGEFIDNMDQALQRAVDNGVKNLVVQPTHLMHGAEYDELVAAVKNYESKFESVLIAEPLLGEVGAAGTDVNADKETAAKSMVAEAVKVAGFDSLDAMAADGTALVFMGHGTGHGANITYTQMQTQMKELGYNNVFVGTVEGNPPETAFPEVKKAVEAAGYTKVILRPMMVVAGDHANNDMASDEEGSWYYGFVNGGEFEVEGAEAPVDTGKGFGADNVTCQIEGLGRIAEIKDIYVAHSNAVINPPVAAESAKVTLTVSIKGELAKTKDGKPMANKTVTVKDLDKDGILTYDEALQAAHKKYNSEDGYGLGDPFGYGMMVTKLWGVDTTNTLFYNNKEGIPSGVLYDTVKAGDKLVASVNADDAHYADWFTYFTKDTKETKVGNKVTLTLKGHLGMAYLPDDLKNVPLEGIKVKTASGEELGTTDKDGKVTFRLYKKGTYYITAEGTVTDEVSDWTTGEEKIVEADCPIIAPVCKVKVAVKEATPKVTLSKKAYTYNGKAKKPAVTVKVGSKKLTKSDYKVTYAKGRKNVGKYSVKVTLKNNYKGEKTVTFKVNPKKATINKLVASKKAITVKWKKVSAKMSSKRITGYQIQLATDKAFTKNKVSKKVTGYKKTSLKVKNLKAKKRYYVRVRTFTKIGDDTFYSEWSKLKSKKTK